MVLKESKLFQISGFAKTVLLAITIVIAGCGGGGGSSSADPYQPSVDSTAPVITLQGGNPQAVDLNAEYQEAGASADTGETVVIDSTAVDTASVGSYTVTYNVTDAAGNQAAEKTRTVNVTDPTVNFAILHTGQSLAGGGSGGDYVEGVSNTNFPNRIYMFAPKPVAWDEEILSNNLIELTESLPKITIAHSLTNNLALNNENTYIFHGQAFGGSTYEDLKKGGITGTYSRSLDQVKNTFNQYPDIIYKAITIIHGEWDGVLNTTNYSENLNEWVKDFNLDIKAITGQASDIQLYICQVASASGYGFINKISSIYFPTTLEQLKAHINNQNITLVAPKYFLPYNDHSHITNLGQRILGEYYAKAIEYGSTYEPLRPKSITSSGDLIYIDFIGAVGELVFDESLVKPIANYGFDYVDDNGNYIKNIQIVNNTIVITLSGDKSNNAFVSYAYQNGDGGAISQLLGFGERGNLRDNNPQTSTYDKSYKLYNWAVTFKEELK